MYCFCFVSFFSRLVMICNCIMRDGQLIPMLGQKVWTLYFSSFTMHKKVLWRGSCSNIRCTNLLRPTGQGFFSRKMSDDQFFRKFCEQNLEFTLPQIFQMQELVLVTSSKMKAILMHQTGQESENVFYHSINMLYLSKW